MSLFKPCNYCGTHCDFGETENTIISMSEMNNLKKRYKDTKTGVVHRVECDLCGVSTVRWDDEKIECSYCGVLI